MIIATQKNSNRWFVENILKIKAALCCCVWVRRRPYQHEMIDDRICTTPHL